MRRLKSEEARRKRDETGALRKQCQAFESLALERRAAEAAQRQKMHDAVVCARYGMPSSGV